MKKLILLLLITVGMAGLASTAQADSSRRGDYHRGYSSHRDGYRSYDHGSRYRSHYYGRSYRDRSYYGHSRYGRSYYGRSYYSGGYCAPVRHRYYRDDCYDGGYYYSSRPRFSFFFGI